MDGLSGRNVRHRMNDLSTAVNLDVQDILDNQVLLVVRVLRVNLAVVPVLELKVKRGIEDIQDYRGRRGLRETQVHLEGPSVVYNYLVRQP